MKKIIALLLLLSLYNCKKTEKETNVQNTTSEFITWKTLTKEEQKEINQFWNNFKNCIQTNQKEKVIQCIQFPLEGEWGFAIGLKKEGNQLTKKDFENGYEKIFTKKIKDQIINSSIDSLSFISHSKQPAIAFRFVANLNTQNDEFESSRFFNFRKTEKGYKLYLIWHAG